MGRQDYEMAESDLLSLIESMHQHYNPGAEPFDVAAGLSALAQPVTTRGEGKAAINRAEALIQSGRDGDMSSELIAEDLFFCGLLAGPTVITAEEYRCPDQNCGGHLFREVTSDWKMGIWRCDGLTHTSETDPLRACKVTHLDGDAP